MRSRLGLVAIQTALVAVPWASTFAADGGTPDAVKPDTSAWSDRTLSPEQRAEAVLKQLTWDEKRSMVSGYKGFYVCPIPRLGLRPLSMSDASAGLRCESVRVDRSISYPATVGLAATWEPELARRYGNALGGECRAWGVDILLGPGVNIYRNSQCGRNFEYMGEDPFLTGRIATN